MAKRYKVEYDLEAHVWLVLMPMPDGIDDVINEYPTKKDAQAAIRRMRDEDAAIESAERHYWAQHCYACGERD